MFYAIRSQIPKSDAPMTIHTLASINLDHVYRLPHHPTPGETLAATATSTHLGGKGANQALAIARAEGKVRMGGMIHKTDTHWLTPLTQAGVDTTAIIEQTETATGHAIIALDEAGENTIILAPLSNQALPASLIATLLDPASPNDWALTQNETNQTSPFIHAAKAKGMHVCYSAAPFVAGITAKLLPMVDMLVVNEGEAHALTQHLGKPAEAIIAESMSQDSPATNTTITLPMLIITRGKDGADCLTKEGRHHCPALPAKITDTTGAGDTYLGYMLAGLDNGLGLEEAMQLSAAAPAIQISRLGAAEAIPDLTETRQYLTQHPQS